MGGKEGERKQRMKKEKRKNINTDTYAQTERQIKVHTPPETIVKLSPVQSEKATHTQRKRQGPLNTSSQSCSYK